MNIESFDATARYFASIEKDSRLFVRRRKVPTNARVFVDNRAVFMLGEAGALGRIDLETAVWSTDRVIVEVERADRPILEIAFWGQKSAAGVIERRGRARG
jgi:hypothetical protein